MHEKTAGLAVIIVFVFATIIAANPVFGEPPVGVKPGDWIDYNVRINGTPPPIHDVTWMRMVVLQVQGTAFQVNLTVKYVNGTLYSTI